MTSTEATILNAKSSLNIHDTTDKLFFFRSNDQLIPAKLHISGEHTDRLLVLFNGAVDRKKAPDPRRVFQRSSWAEEFKAHTLNIADPTLDPSNDLSIGWGQAGGNNSTRLAYATLTTWIAECLDITAENITLYGSSAGGFQALQTAPFVRGAQCIVNNPQIDWTYYSKKYVDALIQHVYPTFNAETLREAHPATVSVTHTFSQEKYVPRIKYFLNAASSADYNRQAPHLIRYLNKGRNLASRRCEMIIYSDPNAGHNPLPKATTINEINQVLSGK